MANDEHLKILKQGIEAWNKWRKENPDVRADLSEADLRGADLRDANLHRADLRDADLWGADLSEADLREADLVGINLREADLHAAYMYGAQVRAAHLIGTNLREAHLHSADLSGTQLYGAVLREANLRRAVLREAQLQTADLRKADLREAFMYGAVLHEADLRGADLREAFMYEADLSEADLRGADLETATLIRTDFARANLSGCHIFGISAWGLTLESTVQTDLIITHRDEPVITVDNLEVAQFIYLLLHNEKIREVIDTITSKAVLILGRFTPEQKAVLDALREELRKRNYTPILFDFEKPGSKDLTETVMTLASMARFVIADLSDPNSIPYEVASFARHLLSTPIQPIFCPMPEHPNEFSMFKDLQRLPHVLPIYRYENQEQLIAVLGEKVIKPAEEKVKELRSSG